MTSVTLENYCFLMRSLYSSLILLVSIGQLEFMSLSGNSTVSRWYSVSEIAEHLGVTETTLYKWLQRKDVPGHKVGRLWKFKIDEIDAWVKSDKETHTRNSSDKSNFSRRTK